MFFEIGKVFERNLDKDINDFADFTEKEHLIIAISGQAIRTEWFEKDRQYDFYDLKGMVQSFLSKLLPDIIFRTEFSAADQFTDYIYSLSSGKILGGKGGHVRKQICDLFDVNQDVFIFTFELEHLKNIEQPKRAFKELLKFPKVYRDFAFVFDRNIESEAVVGIIKGTGSKLLHQIKLFDIFQSDSLGENKKSLAFQLEYFDQNRTLTEEEVDKEFRNAIKAVEEKFHAKLRGT